MGSPLPAALALMAALSLPLAGQSRFLPEDVVTYSDCREVVSVVLGPREVYFATANGIWRLDRFSGEPLDPWQWGRGWERAMVLDRARLSLWNSTTATLWLVTAKSLLYYRWGVQNWYRFEGLPAGRIVALGEGVDRVYVDLGEMKPRYVVIDPFSYQIEKRLSEPPENVVWSGVWQPRELPNYTVVPPRLWFNPADGMIRNWQFDRFSPVFDLVDEEFDRRYICYPGLGIGLGDERHFTLDIIQPGPAGADVRAIALVPDGSVWVGGDNIERTDGVSLFDRQSGRWSSFNPLLDKGMDSRRLNAALWHDGYLYCGTDVGFQFYGQADGRWTSRDRFDGLTGANVRALALAGGQLFLGGDEGIDFMIPPRGRIFPAKDKRMSKVHVADMAANADTVWAATLEGLFRWDPQTDWRGLKASDDAVGEEAARCLAVTPHKLWVGGRRGIRELNRATGKWRGWLGSQYLNGGLPLCMAANDSLLWVGTDRGLFAIHHRKGSFLHYSTGEGLPAARIQTLEVEADTLWLGTTKGLTRFIWNRPARDVF